MILSSFHQVLRRHINVKHRKIKSFDCKHCSYTCTTKSALLTHRNEQHHSLLFFDNNGGEENNSELNSSTRSNNHSHFKCCFCSYQTASKKSFQEHFDEIHDGNRSQCLECEFKAPVSYFNYSIYIQYTTFLILKFIHICL